MERYTYRDKENPQWVGTIDRSNGTESQNSQCVQRLCELEDKLESGQLVELPCKVGDTVWILDDPYFVADIFQMEVEDIKIGRSKIIVSGYHECEYQDFIGSFVFKTKEQAEAKLKELQENK